MKLIVARHGITKLNKENKVNGRIDEELAPEGRQQALELAQRLASSDIDVIYSSPLKRAVQTAEPLSERLGIPIITDERLTEVDFGELSGKSQSEIAELLGQSMVELLSSYQYDLSAYRGETNGQVKERTESFIDELKTKEHEVALIIAHGGIVRMLSFVCTGEKIGYQPNAHELTYTI